MSLMSAADTAPRARVLADRWFSNVAGSSSRRRQARLGDGPPAPSHRTCRETHQRPSASSRPRATHHARLQPAACLVLVLLLALLSPVRAHIYTPPTFPEALQLRDILVDPRFAPEAPADTARRRRELLPRADDEPSSNGPAATNSAAKSASPTSRFQAVSTTAFPSSASSAAGSATISGGIVTETGAPTGLLPRPFDTSLGNNFTNPSCPQFFNTFLNDPTLKSCVPLSLLLMNSQSFFEVQTNPATLQRVLDISCAAVSANCADLLDGFAAAIAQPANCAADLAAQNPVVQRAQAGFRSYRPLYDAGCLKADPAAVSAKSPSEYCFAATSRNTSQPADQYLYYLALGVAFPGGSRPSCSSCTQKTMQTFAQAARNMSSPLAGTYVNAATQVNSKCGPNFVNATITPLEGSEPGKSGAAPVSISGGVWVAFVMAMAASITL